MPTYEYACEDCEHEMEAFQRMSEDPLKDCPACNKPSLKRKIGLGAGIIFKGGGFYETDFKDKKGGASKSSDSGSESSSKESSGTKMEEKKAETPKKESAEAS